MMARRGDDIHGLSLGFASPYAKGHSGEAILPDCTRGNCSSRAGARLELVQNSAFGEALISRGVVVAW